jgi:hypothetical protein
MPSLITPHGVIWDSPIISIKTATSTAVTSSRKIALPLWLSGVSLRPEIYRLQGYADRFELI